MSELKISLLGGFDLVLDGRSLSDKVSEKGQALLAYLAAESERSHRRSTLAALLWGNHPERVSRANLRQALHRVLQACEQTRPAPPYLLVTNQSIQFNLHSQAWVDVIQFRHMLTACAQSHPPDRRVCPECVAQVRAAVALYRGDLLVGVSLPGCQEFEWWLTCKQEEYHQRMIETLKGLVNYFKLEHDYPHALQYTQQAIELEPWNEAFHRHKMSLLAASGARCAALRQYETCRLILAKELNLEPESETTRLFQQIREGMGPT